jgi:hypothetical protein
MLFLRYFNMTAEKLPDRRYGFGKPDALDAEPARAPRRPSHCAVHAVS